MSQEEDMVALAKDGLKELALEMRAWLKEPCTSSENYFNTAYRWAVKAGAVCHILYPEE